MALSHTLHRSHELELPGIPMTLPIQWLLDLATWSMTAFAVGLFLSQLLAREIGYFLGKRHRSRSSAEPEGVGVLVGSMLGLLAFVLALTLSFATERYEERQSGTLAEANAIGTAWLRANAIDAPQSRDIARLLVEYTSVRADYVRAAADAKRLEAISQKSGELQTVIWAHASALAKERPDPIVALLLAALNETFDASTAERFAFEKRLPVPVIWLLIGMALISMGPSAFNWASGRRPCGCSPSFSRGCGRW